MHCARSERLGSFENHPHCESGRHDGNRNNRFPITAAQLPAEENSSLPTTMRSGAPTDLLGNVAQGERTHALKKAWMLHGSSPRPL
jgi:hypothetical protein